MESWNDLVWISFLVFNSPLTESEFAEITARRAGQGSRDGLDIIDDAPLVGAGRWKGTSGAVNATDYALSFVAGPAVTFAELLVVASDQLEHVATVTSRSLSLPAAHRSLRR